MATAVVAADIIVIVYTRSKPAQVQRRFICVALILTAAWVSAAVGSVLASAGLRTLAYALFVLTVVLAVVGMAFWVRAKASALGARR